MPSLWSSLARETRDIRDSRISTQPEVCAGDETENGQYGMDVSRSDLPFSLGLIYVDHVYDP